MIPDLDIYRSAYVLVQQHGEDAPLEAGDLDGLCGVEADRQGDRGAAEQGAFTRDDGAVDRQLLAAKLGYQKRGVSDHDSSAHDRDGNNPFKDVVPVLMDCNL